MSNQATLQQIQQLLQQLAQGGSTASGQGGSTASGQGGSTASGQGGSTARGHADYTPRERLQAMLLRAYIDEDYASSLKADPAGALRRVGFSDSDARELTQQPRGVDAITRGSCFDTTCIISLCPSSCVASVPAIPGVCTESAATNPITQIGGGILGSIFGGF